MAPKKANGTPMTLAEAEVALEEMEHKLEGEIGRLEGLIAEVAQAGAGIDKRVTEVEALVGDLHKLPKECLDLILDNSDLIVQKGSYKLAVDTGKAVWQVITWPFRTVTKVMDAKAKAAEAAPAAAPASA